MGKLKVKDLNTVSASMCAAMRNEDEAGISQALDDLAAEHKSSLLKAYKAKAALMAGLPEELAERLTGDTEEDIAKDAENLAALTKSKGTPHFEAEGGVMSDVEKYFYDRNKNLDPRTRKENA